VGNWNLGPNDQFLVGNFNISRNWLSTVGGLDVAGIRVNSYRAQAGLSLSSFNREDLFIRNSEWFGLLQSLTRSVRQVAIYPKWIHTVPYHVNDWWGG
jgi:hypothetical protein